MIEMKIKDICRATDRLGHVLTYRGDFESNKLYCLGDVVCKDGYDQVFDGEKWQIIGKQDPVRTIDMDAEGIEILPLKCKCCGAPLSYHNGKLLKCFYCGTEYGKETIND